MIRVILSVERNDYLGSEEVGSTLTHLLEVRPNDLTSEVEAVDSLFTLYLLSTVDNDLGDVLLASFTVGERALLDTTRNTYASACGQGVQELCKLFPGSDAEVRLSILTTSLISSGDTNLGLEKSLPTVGVLQFGPAKLTL